ncbi:hypothetical protein GCM10027022_02110 [Alpinimonas psychrophila]|uniref:PBP domain-containing protein n=1 Tax=Alpinimonas psychrophila TaxID=748908 RepID=A0A7W3JRT0_9MICO|nr:hypothetical protein [Alpinimonas psychrophila]MBA8828020.1 hypothetical protein [Alpinimonas psychrophila]
MLSRRRHRKNPLILSASATGIIVGLLVSVSTGLAISITDSQAAHANSSSSQTLAAVDYDLTASADPQHQKFPMPNLAVTVSQTSDLVSQGIVVSWTGAEQSVKPDGSTGGKNFLQIAQCWGEDPLNPGHPDRTTCQYGGFSGKAGAARSNTVACANVNPDPAGDDINQPVLDPNDFVYTTGKEADYTAANACPSVGSPFTGIPFRAANDGGVIASVFPDPTGADTSGRRHAYYLDPITGWVQKSTGEKLQNGVALPAGINGVNLQANQFYSQYTTNEVPWAGSGAGGSGSYKFEIQNAVQNPYLGCGTNVTLLDGSQGPQPCWLVVIPRGVSDSGASGITKSGLFWDAWKHHIAFKLDFKPLAVRCDIGGTEKQLSGSELIAGAVASWQPKLCSGAAGSSFVLSTGNEEDALTKASQTSPSPLALTSRPLQSSGKDPVQYAPVALSGLALSFSIDRNVRVTSDLPAGYAAKDAEAFTSMKLTPRLVAKLLTNSYVESLPAGGNLAHIGYVNYSNAGPNALNLTKDPDFLKVNDDNPEWKYQALSGPSLADLLLPLGRSDEALQLWSYVMSDPDAVAFLGGAADSWGMKVNPWYSTNSSINPSGTGMKLPRTNFPKADPVEKITASEGLINLVTWRPYTSDFDQGASLTLRGDGLELGDWTPASTPPKYGKSVRQLAGTQRVVAVTTAASANLYQNVTASLLNSAGEFVAPTQAGMAAAAAAMTPTEKNSSVVEYNFESAQALAAADAYPLTMPVYAALNPLQTDAQLRAKYSGFIRYAVQSGQTSGTSIGQLPPGYAPIPQSWADQALASATAIEQGISPLSLVTPSTTAGGQSSQTAARRAVPLPSDVAATDPNPQASGAPAGALVGKPTPDDPVLGPVSAAIPAGLLSGLSAAAAFPLFSRFRRRLP